MMFRVDRLELVCRGGTERLDFSSQISFFHGQISSGKSTIPRLIDYCFGGDYEETRALRDELISVQLHVRVRETSLMLTRAAGHPKVVTAEWETSGDLFRAQVPLQGGAGEFLPGIGTLSDLLLALAGLPSIRIPKSRQQEGGSLVRLSFRDVFRFCYLPQTKMDSTFFDFDVPVVGAKRKVALQYCLGLYSDALAEAEAETTTLRAKLSGLQSRRNTIAEFLRNFGMEATEDIERRVAIVESELASARSDLEEARGSAALIPQANQKLKEDLTSLAAKMAEIRSGIDSTQERIEEHLQLKAELTLARFKMTRVNSASRVLGDVEYQFCPRCGQTLDRQRPEGACSLCLQPERIEASAIPGDVIQDDLQERIRELEEAIDRHRRARSREEKQLERLQNDRRRLEEQYVEEQRHYDSRYLTLARKAERDVAMLEERVRSLRELGSLPTALEQLSREAADIGADLILAENRLNREREAAEKRKEALQVLASDFLRKLVTVGYPGATEADTALLEMSSLEPKVYSGGDESKSWGFYSGSAGKKTLFNVCFALALHQLSEQRDLPLPAFLVIDSPMKNIDSDVNREIFERFYEMLFSLAAQAMPLTQFIVVDNHYVPKAPEGDSPTIFERYMTPDDPEHPPLIPWYRGP